MPSGTDVPPPLYDPDPHRARRLQAIDETLDSDPAAALAAAEGALEASPRDPDYLVLAAIAALITRQTRRAERYLKRFGKYWEGPTEIHLLRAIATAQQGRWQPALRILEHYGLLAARVRVAFPFGESILTWLGGEIAEIERQAWLATAHSSLRTRRIPGRRGKKARSAPQVRRGRDAASPAEPSARLAPAAPPSSPPPLPPDPDPLPQPTARVAVRIEPPPGADILALHGDGAEPGWPELRWELARLGLLQDFDELLCLPLLRGVETYWYQVETARKVLRQFHGRVLLGDEVGLGKTIEAGMVLKEYSLRGMAERILVLSPPSLVSQWQEEMATKFDLAFATSQEPLLRRDPEAFWAQKRVIASLATARRPEHAERLRRWSWEVVVVDEAHHLKSRATRNWKLVDGLRKRFLLLLSATPVQNNLVELYNLLTLLKPGIFPTQREFRRRYMVSGNPRRPANRERLHELMRDVMIRNTRAVVDLRLPRRQAATLRAAPDDEEAACYDELGRVVSEVATQGEARQRLALRHLLAAAGSTPAAAAAAIERFVASHDRWAGPAADRWSALARRYRALPQSAKETALLELLARNRDEKVIVFAYHRATLERLAERLTMAGHSLSVFSGDLSGAEKDAAVARFRSDSRVLLSSESGGEGRNLQFCNTLVNFDLPWNPMVIEQRIGRLHRIGQQRDVFVFNLVVRGTAEEQLLALLDEKIHMFELVVGEIGSILGELDDEQGFAEAVFTAWINSSGEARAGAFAALGDRLARAHRRYEAAKSLDDELFADELATA